MNPEAVRYLITVVNPHLVTFLVAEGEARRRLEQEFGQVQEELRNVEGAILAGVVSETAALVQDREAQRRALRARLAALDAQRETGPLPVDAATVAAQLAKLHELLGRDVAPGECILPDARRPDRLRAGPEGRTEILPGDGRGEGR